MINQFRGTPTFRNYYPQTTPVPHQVQVLRSQQAAYINSSLSFMMGFMQALQQMNQGWNSFLGPQNPGHQIGCDPRQGLGYPVMPGPGNPGYQLACDPNHGLGYPIMSGPGSRWGIEADPPLRHGGVMPKPPEFR